MTNLQPIPATVVRPGEGRQGELGPIGVEFKLSGLQTDGALAVVEHPFPVGALVPPHRHTREDEYSIVIEGEIGFRSEDRETVLSAGGYIAKPRGELHSMWNAGDRPARMIEIITPAGFEGFFGALSDLVRAGPLQQEALVVLSQRYGVEFGQPAWLPDVIARYGLTPPD